MSWTANLKINFKKTKYYQKKIYLALKSLIVIRYSLIVIQ